MKDFLEEVLYSGKYDIPPEIETIMRPYKPRNLRFFTPNSTFPIHDFTNIPNVEDLHDLIWVEPDFRTTADCAEPFHPSDGSCLNIIVEEPLPIAELEKEGDARFVSREVVIYLNEHGIEVQSGGCPARIALGRENGNRRVVCKLIGQEELEPFQALEPFNPSIHRIVSLLFPPHPLPTGQYLITMPHCGLDLRMVYYDMVWRLEGTRIQTIARQLCEAIRFLHSHNFYHLDIKPQNLALGHPNSDLTVIDLGCTMYGVPPCIVKGAVGTYEFVAPEVRVWFDWEDTEGDPPPAWNPRRADAWAIGNVIALLLDLDEIVVDHRNELMSFSDWMMNARPSMDEALQELDTIIRSPRQPNHLRSGSSSSIDTTFSISSTPAITAF
ncbi:kinase-like protein [Marasmius fiardii PR-910]|nr:kinase-like protein [Marasmius fiardii PR-910]